MVSPPLTTFYITLLALLIVCLCRRESVLIGVIGEVGEGFLGAGSI